MIPNRIRAATTVNFGFILDPTQVEKGDCKMAASTTTSNDQLPPRISLGTSSICCPAASLFRTSDTQIKYEHLVAGVAGGLISSAILHPLDTIKTRLAVNGSQLICAGVRRPQYGGLVDVLTSITRIDGYHGLYRGVTLGIISAGSTWGSYFFFYDVFKGVLQKDDPTKPLGPIGNMTAAVQAGLVTLVLTNPIWVIKTRLCLQFCQEADKCVSEMKRYKGMRDALIKTYRHEGLRKGLYRGFLPGALGVSHSAIQFMLYEEMKNGYNQYRNLPLDTKMNAMTYLSFAAVSKLLAVMATYPYQLMRTRMQDQFHEFDGAMDILIRTWRHEGIRGFYKGMLPTLLRVTPATAITFVVYENVSRQLIQMSENNRKISSGTVPAGPLSPSVL